MNYRLRKRRYSELVPDYVIHLDGSPISYHIRQFHETDFTCAELTPLMGSVNSVQSTWARMIRELGLKDEMRACARGLKVYLVKKEVAK